MKVHKGYTDLSLNRSVATVGSFDGVHAGHRYVLGKLRSKAAETGGQSVVITFDPHPGKIVSGDGFAGALLTTTEEKISLIGALGIEHLVILKFNRTLSSMSSETFLVKVLSAKAGVSHLLIGFNHTFGHLGSFDLRSLSSVAGSLGITTELMEARETEGSAVSSTRIREALTSGDLALANKMLGYCYCVEGKVVKGKGIGRRIGYPTANVKPESADKLIPANGVYAVEVILGAQMLPGVMSIGLNPTVTGGKGKRTIEVHMPGFSGNIYGEKIRVIFRHRMRDEREFASVGGLISQIEEDTINAMELLKRK